MSSWLDFFEAARQKEPRPPNAAINHMEVDSFRGFIEARRCVRLLKVCLIFAILSHEEERALFLKLRNLESVTQIENELMKLPSTEEDLKKYMTFFPRGFGLVHARVFEIMLSEGYAMLKIAESIPEDMFFSVVQDEHRPLFRTDIPFLITLDMVRALYGRCENMYEYHKKHEWASFNDKYHKRDGLVSFEIGDEPIFDKV